MSDRGTHHIITASGDFLDVTGMVESVKASCRKKTDDNPADLRLSFEDIQRAFDKAVKDLKN